MWFGSWRRGELYEFCWKLLRFTSTLITNSYYEFHRKEACNFHPLELVCSSVLWNLTEESRYLGFVGPWLLSRGSDCWEIGETAGIFWVWKAPLKKSPDLFGHCPNIPDNCNFFSTHANFLVNFFSTQKRINRDKTDLQQKCVNCDKTNSTT